MPPLTPEWTVAIIAVGGIIFQTGFILSKLDYLSKNAVTKQDLDLMRMEMQGKDRRTEDITQDLDSIKRDLKVVGEEIASLRVSYATVVAEFRAIKDRI